MRYVFINKSGEVVIDAGIFKTARSFHNGLAAVMTESWTTGFIDKFGNVVIKPEFEEARDFSDQRAAVLVSRDKRNPIAPHWGYIDQTGKMIIAAKYETAYDFSDGIALAENGTTVLKIMKDGRSVPLFDKGRFQFAGPTSPRFSEGLLAVRDSQSGKYGYIDTDGKPAIGFQFEHASLFQEGLARASVIGEGREMLGFIDRTGRFLIPPMFDVDYDFWRNSTDFSEGLASLIYERPTGDADSKFVYINRRGTIVLKTPYFYASEVREGLAYGYEPTSGSYEFFDSTGSPAIPSKFKRAAAFSEGLACVAVETAN